MAKPSPLTRAKHKRALVCCQAKQFEVAKHLYEQICQKSRTDTQAWMMLGVVEMQLGSYLAAELALRQARMLTPSHYQTLFNLGMACYYQAKFDDAQTFLRDANQIEPKNTDCLCALGDAGVGGNQYGQAVTAYRRAIELSPKNSWARGNLAHALMNQGRIEEAITEYRSATSMADGEQSEGTPGYSPASLCSSLLLCLNYRDDLSAKDVFQEHQHWASQYASVPQLTLGARSGVAGRKIRIGYVTPDLREHAVAYFLEPLFSHHDRARFELYGYAELAGRDATTERLAQHLDVVCDTRALSDDRFAQRIAQDGIDILIDLAGHTGQNRLAVFARRPAPIQLSYLGYPASTGLEQMDYRLTDAWADPEGFTEAFHTEKLIRLPSGFLCFSPPQESPPVGPLPAFSNGFITFGVFNNFAKLTSRTQAMWVQVLRAIPNTRLLIKCRQLSDEFQQNRLTDYFKGNDIDLKRIDMIGHTSKAEYMQAYNHVDVAIDSFPYHGTTTTCDALWMGVPVMTIAGKTHVSRVGVSLLNQVQLPEMVVKDEQGLVTLAMYFAGNFSALSEIRSTLRETMSRSHLCDGPAFATEVEAVYERLCRSIE